MMAGNSSASPQVLHSDSLTDPFPSVLMQSVHAVVLEQCHH